MAISNNRIEDYLRIRVQKDGINMRLAPYEVNQDATVFLLISDDGKRSSVVSLSGLELLQNNTPDTLISLLSSRYEAARDALREAA